MLKLPPHDIFPQFHLNPDLTVEFSPVLSEEDELIQAIEDSRGEQWQLEHMPDNESLGEFWSGVNSDLHDDPSWTTFTD